MNKIILVILLATSIYVANSQKTTKPPTTTSKTTPRPTTTTATKTTTTTKTTKTTKTTPTTTTTQSIQSNLHLQVDSFIKKKKLNGTKLPTNKTRQRGDLLSNMRQTNDNAKNITDLTDFIQQFVTNSSNTAASNQNTSSIVKNIYLDPSFCPFKNLAFKCDSTSKYQTNDGSCNNLKNPIYGISNSPYKRYLTPAYSDGFFAPRLSSSGKALPNVRNIR